jgi:tetratricopeptide (TPR) repeat protein
MGAFLPSETEMSRPSETAQKKQAQARSFKEHVDTLFEELSFAVKWHRPSILLVSYESETTRGAVELALERRLDEIEQQVVPFGVDKMNYDIPLLLSQRPDREHSVYSVAALSQGGGKGGANAYRALNMRREFFVDYSMKIILWLAKGEVIKLSRQAPDFWAFRHRLVEINDPADPERFLKKGIDLARQLNNFGWLAEFWGSLGLTYRESGQLNRAIRAYWKAIRLNPQNTRLLSGLGQVYLAQGRAQAARKIFKKASQVNPPDANT